MRTKLKDSEITKLLQNITILIDTAEKENTHIEEYFKKHRVNFKKEKLKEGDYSAFIAYNEETSKILESIDVYRDLYFTDNILIERKKNLDELANNLSTRKGGIDYSTGEIRNEKRERERFKYELTRINICGAKAFIYIEDPKGHQNIRKGNYRSEYKPVSFLGSLKSFEAEFNIPIVFLDKSVIGSEIYNTIKYTIKNILRQL